MLLVAGAAKRSPSPISRACPTTPSTTFSILRFMIERVGFYVKTDSSWKSMKELVEDARKNPEKYTYCHLGDRRHPPIPLCWFEKRAGIRMRHVPHKGGAETLARPCGGHVNRGHGVAQRGLCPGPRGRIRPLAHSSLPGSPVSRTLPLCGSWATTCTIENQKGFGFPKNTPKPIVQKLHDSLKKVFDDLSPGQRPEASGGTGLPQREDSTEHEGHVMSRGSL